MVNQIIYSLIEWSLIQDTMRVAQLVFQLHTMFCRIAIWHMLLYISEQLSFHANTQYQDAGQCTDLRGLK